MPETPTHLLPTAQPAAYPSTEDLLGSAGGTVESNVTVPFWTLADGSPVTVRVRALDFPTQSKVRLRAMRAVDPKDRAIGISRDEAVFAAATLAEGIANPRLTLDQALSLIRGRHARAVELLVNYIWTLSAVDQETINAVVDAEAASDLAAADELAAGGADGTPAPADE